jgi:glycosyltransferase involved in cell wall biosynthesis
MRILLIANYVPDSQQSMQRYAALLQDGFMREGHEVRVLRPSVIAGRLATNATVQKWLGYIDKLFLFPIVLKRAVDWPDIVHICDHSNAFYVKHVDSRPHVITCHDLLAVRSALGEFPQQETRWSGRKLQRMILAGLARSRNIISVSDATRADILRLVRREGQEIARIYNGLSYPYAAMDHEQTTTRLDMLGLTSDTPFLLHVGGNQWYKNRLGVLKIFALVRNHDPNRNLLMVMAGKRWTEEMRKFVQLSGIESSVIELVDVTNEDLRALYSRAEALLFPSLEEGFGWPIVEAQACGCPVVTSNRAPMNEVGGGAAKYVDPLNHVPAAVTVASVIGSRCRAVSNANMRSAARFSTAAMLDSYLEMYSQVLVRRVATQISGASYLREHQ